ncbi:Zn-finger in Ran binding protein and others domain-containing protein [Besnoitia besnoiti]|uniref:Zn-finger in Ran binding protein and others domain-containing protein n=1 Tax=Besnoitia besnoiti TaxID=94643 RepID=A0A2A9M549_BESBE|nr:Zn-finger in Ran binding protein and others domain-containing protein [Besnoitia besnoiti]PFH33069.1 Zn-finger in Ran binding protein and others domain-containing protein [Besnoitia besnoiti]
MSPEVTQGYGAHPPAPGATTLVTVNSEKNSKHPRQESETSGDLLSGISTPQTLSGAASFHPALGGASETSAAPSPDSRGDSGVDIVEQSSLLYSDLGMNFLPLAISAASSSGDLAGGISGPSTAFPVSNPNGSALLRDSSLGVGYPGVQDLASLMIPSLNGNAGSVVGVAQYQSPEVLATGSTAANGSRNPASCSPGTPHGGAAIAARVNAREPPRMGEGGNWRCNNCSNINYPRRRACNRCGCARSAVNDLLVAEFTRLKDELQNMGLDAHTASQAAAAQQAAQHQGRLLNSMLDLLGSDTHQGGSRARQAQHQGKSSSSFGLASSHTRSGLCNTSSPICTTDGPRGSSRQSSQPTAACSGPYASQLVLLNNTLASLKIGLASATGTSATTSEAGAGAHPSQCGSGGATLVTPGCANPAGGGGDMCAAFDLKFPATGTPEASNRSSQTPGLSPLSFRMATGEGGFRTGEEAPVVASSLAEHGAAQYTAVLQLMLLKAKDVADALVVYFQELGDPDPTSKAADVLRTALAMLGHSTDSRGNDTSLGERKDEALTVSSASSAPGIRNNSGSVRGIGGPNFSAPTMLAHPDEFKNPSSFLKIYGDPLCGSADLSSGNGQNPVKSHHGNWVCRNCKNVNFPRRFRCNKCGEIRDEEGDRIVAEYAKLVHHHYLKAYKHLASNPQGASGGWSPTDQMGTSVNQNGGEGGSRQSSRKNRNLVPAAEPPSCQAQA